MKATRRIGECIQQSNTDGIAMIVLEGERPLGDSSHQYYEDLIRQFSADPTHVRHIQDFWGDPLDRARARKAPTARPRMFN